MLQTFLSYFGGYVLIGLISSLIVNYSEFKDLIRNPGEDELKELSVPTLILQFAWPIVVPLLAYLCTAEKIVGRHQRKLDKQFRTQMSLLFFLEAVEVIEDDTPYRKALDKVRHAAVVKRRKRFGLGG